MTTTTDDDDNDDDDDADDVDDNMDDDDHVVDDGDDDDGDHDDDDDDDNRQWYIIFISATYDHDDNNNMQYTLAVCVGNMYLEISKSSRIMTMVTRSVGHWLIFSSNASTLLSSQTVLTTSPTRELDILAFSFWHFQVFFALYALRSTQRTTIQSYTYKLPPMLTFLPSYHPVPLQNIKPHVYHRHNIL